MNKRLFLLTAITMMASTTMKAQWTPSDTDYKQLSEEGIYGQRKLKVKQAKDGKTVLTWIIYNSAKPAYELHMQVLDADGKPRLGKDGVIISDKPTLTSYPAYEIDIAANGDLLATYQDIRNEDEKRQVYVYRYNMDGEPVWSADGIAFESQPINPESDVETSAEDTDCALCCHGDYVFVGCLRQETKEITGTEVAESQWQVRAFDAQGKPTTTEPIRLRSTILKLMPAPDGDVYGIYDTPYYNVMAQRWNATLTNQWADGPVEVDWDPLNKDITYKPSILFNSTDDGGVAMTYNKAKDNNNTTVYNYLSPEGKVISSSDAPTIGDIMGVRVDNFIMGTYDQTSLIAWEADYDTECLHVNAINTNGTRKWAEDVKIDENNSWMGFQLVDIVPQKDGWILIYGKVIKYTSDILCNYYVEKIGLDGTIAWTKQIFEDNFGMTESAVTYDEQYIHLLFTQNIDNSRPKGLFVLTIDMPDATPIDKVVATRHTVTGWISLDGLRYEGRPAAKGVYVRNGKKFVIK